MATTSGVVTAKVLTAKTFEKKFTFPSKVSNVEIRNSSGCDIKLSFDDDLNKDKYTIRGLDKTPVLIVQGGKTILKYLSLEDDCKLELLMWG